MDKLYSWRAKRAGGMITVTHSCGKVPHIDTIEPDADGNVVATAGNGRKYHLVAAVHTA